MHPPSHSLPSTMMISMALLLLISKSIMEIGSCNAEDSLVVSKQALCIHSEAGNQIYKFI